MRVQLSKIIDQQSFIIEGTEDWLAEIYKMFPAEQSQKLTLKAEITIRVVDSETYILSGSLSYCPKVPCSRCNLRIPWPIEQTFEQTYVKKNIQSSASDDTQEHDSGSPDVFEVTDGTIDLEQALNEQVVLGIPSQTIRKTPDGKACQICNKDISQSLIYGSEANLTNPFAKLKDLKLKH